MNRLTAIGLASLVAYGLLIASKYAGVVTEAHDAKSAPRADVAALDKAAPEPAAAAPGLVTQPLARMPLPVGRPDPVRASPVALEFRQSRDLKAFADALLARRENLTPDERYHLAKALEECQFTASVNEDMAAYAAKQHRLFLASLPLNDPNNAKRVTAYEAVDNTQRCARFQNSKISQKDIDDLFQAAAQEGDVRAQARILVASLNKANQQTSSEGATPRVNPR